MLGGSHRKNQGKLLSSLFKYCFHYPSYLENDMIYDNEHAKSLHLGASHLGDMLRTPIYNVCDAEGVHPLNWRRHLNHYL
jgi:hypothetical protein